MTTERPSAACTLCGTPTDHVLTDRLRRGRGTVYYCAGCDFGFLVPERQVDSKAYYSEGYWKEVSHQAKGAGTNPQELFDVYRRFQGGRLAVIAPHLSPSTKLLDVGAAAGQFLVHVKDRVARADAIELDKSCCEFLRTTLGVDADSAYLRQSKFASEKYDVVCSFQVLEHVDSPVDFLRDLRDAMGERAVAFVDVPNLRDHLLAIWDVPTYRTFYYHAAHLSYFTEKSLRKVAMDAGFRPDQITIRFMQDYNVLNTLHWIMNDAPQPTPDWGLGEIDIRGRDPVVGRWLTERVRELDRDFNGKLAEAKATSNIMAVLTTS